MPKIKKDNSKVVCLYCCTPPDILRSGSHRRTCACQRLHERTDINGKFTIFHMSKMGIGR